MSHGPTCTFGANLTPFSLQSIDIMCDDFAVQLSMFFYDPDGNEVEITTWDCVRDDSCARFGQIDDRSIRGDTAAAAVVAK
jgi:hypothetical protein